MKGEIWLANLPQWTGKEQLGKRPVLLMSKNVTNLIVAIPLTSNIKTEKYPYTLKIKPSDKNCLTKDSIALIFQIRAIDNKRLIHKIGTLEDSYLKEINQKLKELLKI